MVRWSIVKFWGMQRWNHVDLTGLEVEETNLKSGMYIYIYIFIICIHIYIYTWIYIYMIIYVYCIHNIYIYIYTYVYIYIYIHMSISICIYIIYIYNNVSKESRVVQQKPPLIYSSAASEVTGTPAARAPWFDTWSSVHAPIPAPRWQNFAQRLVLFGYHIGLAYIIQKSPK